jgi:hypothetical protein
MLQLPFAYADADLMHDGIQVEAHGNFIIYNHKPQ